MPYKGYEGVTNAFVEIVWMYSVVDVRCLVFCIHSKANFESVTSKTQYLAVRQSIRKYERREVVAPGKAFESVAVLST